jgi:hypothetical protein
MLYRAAADYYGVSHHQMRFCIAIASLLGALPGAVTACRPVPFVAESLVSEASDIGVGLVTAATHPELERSVLAGEDATWPKYSLQPYEVRVAVFETLRGSMPPILVVPVGGCPPPIVPSERVVAFVNVDGHVTLWRESVLEQVRTALSRDDD